MKLTTTALSSKILVEEGTTVECQTPVAVIGEEGRRLFRSVKVIKNREGLDLNEKSIGSDKQRILEAALIPKDIPDWKASWEEGYRNRSVVSR